MTSENTEAAVTPERAAENAEGRNDWFVFYPWRGVTPEHCDGPFSETEARGRIASIPAVTRAKLRVKLMRVMEDYEP